MHEVAAHRSARTLPRVRELNRRPYTRPPLDEAFGGRLADAFRDDTFMLANVIGRDLSAPLRTPGTTSLSNRRSGGPPPASDCVASEVTRGLDAARGVLWVLETAA